MSEYKNILLGEILPFVNTPGQYTGNEFNMVKKDWDSVSCRIALAFPDTYTVGMSNIGIQILYHILNQREDTLAERVYAPQRDLEQQLRSHGVPILSLESFMPISTFDIIGFSIQTELCYTNMLTMLDLADIPFRSCDRREEDPLILCGGHNINYEPIADFCDAVFIGEGDEAAAEIAEAVIQTRDRSRAERLKALEAIEGMYIPSFFDIAYNTDGTVKEISPSGRRDYVMRRTVKDLDAVPYPSAPVVPNIEVIHQRISIELMRGCPHSCRYCLSGNLSRKIRARSSGRIFDICKESYEATGYEEIGLLSLSSSEYPGILELAHRLSDYFSPKHVSLSLPSLRITENIMDMLPRIRAVRKSGLTFAPETASEELRRLQKKKMKNEELFSVIRKAYEKGWERIKLYFMIGLPGETQEDIDSIAPFVRHVSDLRKDVDGRKGKVNITISPFIPKPCSPFQWEPMNSREMIGAKIHRITRKITDRRIRYRYPEADITMLEGIFSRGDRRLARVIETAWENGARFDRWDESFDADAWDSAFRTHNIDPRFYTIRRRNTDEIMPWSHIRTGCEEYIRRDYSTFIDEHKERNRSDDKKSKTG